jgi:hypothetical protein
MGVPTCVCMCVCMYVCVCVCVCMCVCVYVYVTGLAVGGFRPEFVPDLGPGFVIFVCLI